MGKVKTVVMGDEIQEEQARKKAEAKREQKKAEKKAALHKEDTVESPTIEEVIDHPEPKKSKLGKLDKFAKSPVGKKAVASQSLVDKSKIYAIGEAVDLVKKTSFSKFDGSVELHLNVSDKGLRGSVVLPHGTGKQVRVKIATDALIEEIAKTGKIDFDIMVAEPAMMPKLAKVAKILGPKGLMPNPKTNTISENPSQLVKILQSSVSWKTQNDFPIVHAVIGKVSFDEGKLEENYQALVKSIGKDKIQSVFIKPTMGPSIKIQV